MDDASCNTQYRSPCAANDGEDVLKRFRATWHVGKVQNYVGEGRRHCDRLSELETICYPTSTNARDELSPYNYSSIKLQFLRTAKWSCTWSTRVCWHKIVRLHSTTTIRPTGRSHHPTSPVCTHVTFSATISSTAPTNRASTSRFHISTSTEFRRGKHGSTSLFRAVC